MDYLVVGCGLSGAAMARQLAEQGHKVTIWERRSHIAGNMYDYKDEHGILVHKYGPHTFHTADKDLYEYMLRWGSWQPYELKCMAYFLGKFTPTPFNFQTIDDYYPPQEAADLKQRLSRYFGDRQEATVLEVLKAEDEKIRQYGQFLFRHDYSLYTAKQWGIPASEVDASILERVPLRFSYEAGYFKGEYQMMPEISYTSIFGAMLEHPNIQVELNKDALQHLSIDRENQLRLDGRECPCRVIYTGALDELFGCDMGPLPYRSLRFEWHHEEIQAKQPAAIVAYPEAEGYTRIVEFNKLPDQKTRGTTYEIEYPLPYQAGCRQEPYYPLLTEESQKLAQAYQARANKVKGLYYCGRLADFKYYNMDQALKRALEVCKEL